MDPDGQGGGVRQDAGKRRATAIGGDQDRHLLFGEPALAGDAAPLARLAIQLSRPFAAGQDVGFVGLDDPFELDRAGLDRGQEAMPPAKRGGVRHPATRGRPLHRVALTEAKGESRPELLLARVCGV